MSTQKDKIKIRMKGSQSKTPALEEVNAALEAKMLELEVQLQKKSEHLFEVVKIENLCRQKVLVHSDSFRAHDVSSRWRVISLGHFCASILGLFPRYGLSCSLNSLPFRYLKRKQ